VIIEGNELGIGSHLIDDADSLNVFILVRLKDRDVVYVLDNKVHQRSLNLPCGSWVPQ
jgi:hypothetical protein